MKTNFRFDANKADLIQQSLDKLENSTLQDLAAEHVKGGEWSLTFFCKHNEEKEEAPSSPQG